MNFIDFIHEHYWNNDNSNIQTTLHRAHQHLERQRNLIWKEIASIKQEEETLKHVLESKNKQTVSKEQNISANNVPLKAKQGTDIHLRQTPTALEIEQLNKLPLDL
ncbi:unnamed protein product [Didymodactylos carnosus]|uniref:Uncharacterized protein n=1 Tax=Didymodactylos carnosus TaxID=1234261 RepID=A0A813VNI3_9BILA|nr:unnamed protein product [Didymodactylos carnosus]CAF0840074.1 unnamed protein product [Didymodactylos carnosus]CAF3500723.1 unnamed protein product [Didymodactylos carnosus]CAF3627419.1 unnamed protein product [Didymodactylos carnosus]